MSRLRSQGQPLSCDSEKGQPTSTRLPWCWDHGNGRAPGEHGHSCKESLRRERGDAGRVGPQEPRGGTAPRKPVIWCDSPKRMGSLGLTTQGLKARFSEGGWVARPMSRVRDEWVVRN